MQVHIYLADNNKIQMLIEGQAQGAATFQDFDTFVRFIEGCQEFINGCSQVNKSSTEIPRPFLDAFDNSDSSG
jgi:hypothetical protein